MQEIPKLQVITTHKTSVNTWKNMIERKSLLKTKLKLLQIEQFDRDLKTLHENHLNLPSFNLEDFHLNSSHNLFVPLKDKIIPSQEKESTILRSYLIYLSYLYNYNFVENMKNPNDLYRTIFSLGINEEIKQSLFRLLNKEEDAYFSDYIDDLSNSEFRESLRADRLKLEHR